MKKSILCVGLDPQPDKIPLEIIRSAVEEFGTTWEALARAIVRFNRLVIKETHEFASVMKPQSAFYEFGHWGTWALEETLKILRHYEMPIILDAKRGDGGDTAQAYASSYLFRTPFFADNILELIEQGVTEPRVLFRWKETDLRVDAMTVQGYIGDSCLKPFREICSATGGAPIVVTRTSFKPESWIETLRLENGRLVWEEIACRINEWSAGTIGGNGFRNIGSVIGATCPAEMVRARELMPFTLFLVPGYGAQGGGADDAVLAVNEDGFGSIVNSSRGIIFAKDIRAAARQSRDDLNAALKRAGKGKAFL